MTVARLALLLALLGGCSTYDAFAGRIDSPGSVYRCDDTPNGPLEYCYFEDAAAELSAATGLRCYESGLFDRWATAFGCWYHCDDPSTLENEGDGKGCNAHLGGCFCEAMP
ncbi:MAG TPA: hypothetical protein VFV99_32330 [Kofleriaceae bacterium]|nr:hypothetical protein [Kofleriaceae bacterium]